MTWHPLHTDLPRPQALNNPFCYEPHPLCRLAASEVKAYLATQTSWQEELAQGKMMGVLVCENAQGELGFLAAYSGQIAGCEDHPWFVPPVFDYLSPQGYFKREEAEISAINRRIAALESASDFVSAKAAVEQLRAEAEREVEAYKTMMHEAKVRRDARRQECASNAVALSALLRESQFQKAQLRRLKKAWQARLTEAEAKLTETQQQAQRLKQERKQRSDALQRWLFDHFSMLNAQGAHRTLTAIFRDTTPSTPHRSLTADTPQCLPPSGAGECCAPKLLQYAFRHHLRPLAIAEFWQGRSPRMEIRHHDHYYPACRGKCRPILAWMLGRDTSQEVSHRPFPPTIEPASPSFPIIEPASPSFPNVQQALVIQHTSPSFFVINKPPGLLSVPGLTGEPSVESILREKYGDIFIVHRLDQATSGLMVVARTPAAYHHLQRQFLARTVHKRYLALLDGIIPSSGSNTSPATSSASANPATGSDLPSGTISLPLRPDLMDRPRQLVDYVHGKPAVTHYQVLATGCGRTLVALTPHTGRTHQLRMHCAHPDGLGIPILGDPLYGHPIASAPSPSLGGPLVPRLYLHADTLSFDDPDTGERLTFHDGGVEEGVFFRSLGV